MCNNDLDWEGMRDKVIGVILHKLWFQTLNSSNLNYGSSGIWSVPYLLYISINYMVFRWQIWGKQIKIASYPIKVFSLLRFFF